MQFVEFLILQICLGRRCLHNHMGFLFSFFPLLSLSSSNSVHLPDGTVAHGITPVAGRTAKQKRAWGGGGKRKKRTRSSSPRMMRFEQEQQLRMAFSRVSPANT